MTTMGNVHKQMNEQTYEWADRQMDRPTDIQINRLTDIPGNTKGGSITVLLTSCLTGLDQCVLQIKTKIVSCHTANAKPVKLEVNGTDRQID